MNEFSKIDNKKQWAILKRIYNNGGYAAPNTFKDIYVCRRSLSETLKCLVARQILVIDQYGFKLNYGQNVTYKDQWFRLDENGFILCGLRENNAR